MSSQFFRSELFTEPREYEETPLRDRKQKFPNLDHDEEKAEFLRDVIAMANTARSWGKPAYLLFGLNNQGNLSDIWDDLQRYCRSERALVDKDEKGLVLVAEQIRHRIAAIFGEYIAPPLHQWDFRLEWLEGNCVAYLSIEPDCREKAFHIARDLVIRHGRRRKVLLSPGECWIRSGESKRDIDRRKLDRNSPCYREVPFVAPSMWLRYFEALRSNLKAARIEPYIDLYDARGKLLAAVIQEWLSEGSRRPILIVAGPPGSGKSTLLCRIVAELANESIQAMEETRRREEFRQPPNWIPVYFPLRETQIQSARTLAKEILRQANSLGNWWTGEPSAPEKLLEHEELQWLVCFDGLDELWEDRRVESFLRQIRTLWRRYPRLKVLVSTRPVVSLPNDIECVHLAGLSERQILQYLQAFVSEANKPFYQQLEKGLSNPESELYPLREICTVPLYLEALANLIAPETPARTEEVLPESVPPDHDQDSGGSAKSEPSEGGSQPQPIPLDELISDIGDEKQTPDDWSEDLVHEEEAGPPITLGWVLDRVVRRVWDREARRRTVERLKLDRWWRATGKLSLTIDGHRRFVEDETARRHYSSRRGLQWVLNLDILRTSREGIAFSHPSVQHYFGAEHLRVDKDPHRWEKECTPDFWRSVTTILNQIQYPEVSYDAAEQRVSL
ncbi:MAG: NACHT domain-containing protein [Anaerolineae bacterium]